MPPPGPAGKRGGGGPRCGGAWVLVGLTDSPSGAPGVAAWTQRRFCWLGLHPVILPGQSGGDGQGFRVFLVSWIKAQISI